jgi:hypothetical protein
VRVAEEVGAGRVKVRLSFSDWKEGNVTPASFELLIADADPKARAKQR